MIKRLVKCRKMASYERTAWVSLWNAFKTLLCDWSRKLPPSSQPTRYRTKHIRDLIISLFPALQQSVCFPFELSLTKNYVNLCSDWFLRWLWFWFFNTLFKTALKTNRAKPVQSQIAPNTQWKSALSIDYQN